VSDGAALGRSDWPWLVSLLLVGCLTLAIFALYAYHFTEGQGGVPLDDAWIHFQFARNLARGDGLSFNPGQSTSGSTAPLWTLLLAAVYLAGGEFPVAGQALSAVCFLTALAATYALGKQLTDSRWAGWLAGVVVAVNGRMVWAGLSGLETCLFATLSLLAISTHASDWAACRYRPRAAVLFGLAALSRPEGYLLFALAMADFMFVLATQGDEPWRTRWRRLPFLPVALFAAIVLPYLIFSLRTSGHLLPNTYHAKATINLLPDRDFLSLAAKYLILDNPLLLPFFLFGLILLLKRAFLLSLWSAGLPLVYAFLHASLYQHGRYLIPLIPCNAVIAMWGLLEARGIVTTKTQRARRLFGRLSVLCALCVFVMSGTAWRLPTMAGQYAWNVDNINEMHVALGHWVAENTSPDAVLALNDIGAITYVSGRPVVDLAGLVTPEIVPILRSPDRDARLLDFMARRDVQYVVIFPNWFPDLAARSDLLEEVHRATLERNTIAGGETMVVYRAHWRR
jgi:arabinofuranosyltransferase